MWLVILLLVIVIILFVIVLNKRSGFIGIVPDIAQPIGDYMPIVGETPTGEGGFELESDEGKEFYSRPVVTSYYDDQGWMNGTNYIPENVNYVPRNYRLN